VVLGVVLVAEWDASAGGRADKKERRTPPRKNNTRKTRREKPKEQRKEGEVGLKEKTRNSGNSVQRFNVNTGRKEKELATEFLGRGKTGGKGRA